MLALSPSATIYFCTKPTDMRNYAELAVMPRPRVAAWLIALC